MVLVERLRAALGKRVGKKEESSKSCMWKKAW